MVCYVATGTQRGGATRDPARPIWGFQRSLDIAKMSRQEPPSASEGAFTFLATELDRLPLHGVVDDDIEPDALARDLVSLLLLKEGIGA